MIAIMSDEGALEFGRALSGGHRFLVWKAALLNYSIQDIFSNAASQVLAAAGIESSMVDMTQGEFGALVVEGNQYNFAYTFDCTGSLPVKVSMEEGGSTAEAMAVDFDFNGQVPLGENGATQDIQYQTVIALGRRFYKYESVSEGAVYNTGDHVWYQNRTMAYVCLTDNFEYIGTPPDEDTEHWASVNTEDLISYPGEKDLYADPNTDVVPFFITAYDSPVTMGNGMEWEYKVRVFLNNIVTTDLSKLQYFSYGGLEANGSLMLTFLASISEQFRTIRNQITTAS